VCVYKSNFLKRLVSECVYQCMCVCIGVRVRVYVCVRIRVKCLEETGLSVCVNVCEFPYWWLSHNKIFYL